MKIILWIQLPIKFLYVISIFIWVTSEADLKLLVLLNSLSMLFIGLVGFVFVITKYNLKIISLKAKQIKTTLINSSAIFISLSSISIYSSNNIFLLGIFANTRILGLFIVAEK